MSLYATVQQMMDRFEREELVQLTDEHATGGIDETKLTQALEDAGATIDGYLQGRYTLPLSVVPRLLERYACDLARYFLYDDRVTEQVEARYKDAMDYLRRVGRGEIGLGLDDAGDSAPGSGGPQWDGPDRVFDTTTLKDY